MADKAANRLPALFGADQRESGAKAVTSRDHARQSLSFNSSILMTARRLRCGAALLSVKRLCTSMTGQTPPPLRLKRLVSEEIRKP
jgi:hypothetical protein